MLLAPTSGPGDEDIGDSLSLVSLVAELVSWLRVVQLWGRGREEDRDKKGERKGWREEGMERGEGRRK